MNLIGITGMLFYKTKQKRLLPRRAADACCQNLFCGLRMLS